jgi:hypothetical protein
MVATPVLALMAGCGAGPNPNSAQEIPASASGIASLFEAECLDWRSFDWAKRNHETERAACIGEITQRSIEDCRANVTGADWTVPVKAASVSFKVSYFFDEVEHPVRAKAMCDVRVPKELGKSAEAAVRELAAKHRLIGPFASGERGFSRPTLKEYWADDRGRPRIGVFYYPANINSSDSLEREYAAHPWILTLFPDDVPISLIPPP